MKHKHPFAVRAVAALVAGAFALATGAQAAQADESTSGDSLASTITITAPTSTGTDNLVPPGVDGRTFVAYQLATYRDITVKDGKVTGYDLAAAPGITDQQVHNWIDQAVIVNGAVAQGFNSIIDAQGNFTGEASNLTPLEFVAKYFYGAGADTYHNDHANSEQMRRFADAAATASLAKDAGVTRVTATGANGRVVLNTPSEGLYLITETDTPAGQMIARAMVTGTPMDVDGTVYDQVGQVTLGALALKAEKVEVTKDVQGNDQPITLDSTRTFVVTTNVPDYSNAYAAITNPQFAIVDTPTANVNPFTDASRGTVRALTLTATDGDGKTTTLVSGTDYTVAAQTDQPTGFTVTLTDPRAWSRTKLAMTYEALVTGVADASNNTVTIDFSNNAYDNSSVGHVTANEQLYTTKVGLDKIKYGTDKTAILQGARFTVTDANGKAVSFTKDTAGNYAVAANGQEDAVTVGTAAILGLGANLDAAMTYTFIETKAPTGYLLGDHPVTFTLTVTPAFDQAGELTQVSYAVNSKDHRNFLDNTDAAMWNGATQTVTVASLTNGSTTLAGGTIYVENTTNASDFAKTGGEITRVLYIVVALAVLGAALIIMGRLRKRAA